MPITVRHLGPITSPPVRPPIDGDLAQVRTPPRDEILRALRTGGAENGLRGALITAGMIRPRDLECGRGFNRYLEGAIHEIQANYRRSIHRAPDIMSSFQNRFLARALELAGTDVIPIPRDEIRRRFERLAFTLVDPIKTRVTEPEFDDSTLTLRIPVPILDGVLSFDDFAHEALHGLAGEDIVQAIVSHDDSHSTQKTRACRRGLYFDVPMPDGRNLLFKWLDEGLVEYLTRYFVTRKERYEDAYPDEVKIIKTLTDAGGRYRVPLRKLTDAYFANYDASAPEGRRYPEWTELNKSLPIATLNRINRIIEGKGVKAGARWLHS